MSPFGYNPANIDFVCPFCKKKWIFSRTADRFAREYREKVIREHFEIHSKEDPQQTLYGTKIDYYREVKDSMKIPESVTSGGATKSGLQFLKAPQMGLGVGATIDFNITSDVEVSERPSGNLYSVPVGYLMAGNKLQGQYSLNKTALRILVTKLGDETTNWIGGRFTAFVSPKRNPQTNGQTLGFDILADSVKTAKSK